MNAVRFVKRMCLEKNWVYISVGKMRQNFQLVLEIFVCRNGNNRFGSSFCSFFFSFGTISNHYFGPSGGSIAESRIASNTKNIANT